jgi:hypothetical protein
MKPDTLEAMLKWTRKRLQQRKSKPLSKHAAETLANAQGCKQTAIRHTAKLSGDVEVRARPEHVMTRRDHHCGEFRDSGPNAYRNGA